MIIFGVIYAGIPDVKVSQRRSCACGATSPGSREEGSIPDESSVTGLICWSRFSGLDAAALTDGTGGVPESKDSERVRVRR